MTEEWRPIADLPGYSVSSRGRVRNDSSGYILKPWIATFGYWTYTIRQNGVKKTWKAHRLVAQAYLPNPRQHPLVRHLNDDPADNRVENLAWGGYSENGGDAVRNGRHPGARKTECLRGHPFNEDNTAYRGENRVRFCLTCDRDRARIKRYRGLPEGDPRHGTVNGAVNFGCKCPDCRVASQSHSRTMYQQKRRSKQ